MYVVYMRISYAVASLTHERSQLLTVCAYRATLAAVVPAVRGGVSSVCVVYVVPLRVVLIVLSSLCLCVCLRRVSPFFPLYLRLQLIVLCIV